MSNILRPWELSSSDEVYVIKYDPLLGNEQKDENLTPEETMSAKNKEEYDRTLAELQKRAEAQQRILLKQEQEILQKANLRAEYIISTANIKAKAERETIVGDAMVEADTIRDDAFAMGYKEGVEKAEAELLDCTERLNASLQEITANHENALEEIKRNIDNISLAIAQKILKKQIEVDPLAMVDLVEDLISENKQAKFIKVEVSDKMNTLIDHIQNTFAKKYSQLSVTKTNKPEGALMVDTPEGVIDASIQTQLDNIRKAITQNYSKEK